MYRVKKPELATYGWMGLTAGVILWDALAPQTLSSAYDRYLEHPVKRIAAIGAVALTGAHLLNVLPPQLDPIQRVGDYVYRNFLGGGDG